MSKSQLFFISIILLIIGGLNWGLIGFFKLDLVASIFGGMSMISRIVYSVVGVAAVVAIFTMPKKS